jgi:hypothetical protein
MLELPRGIWKWLVDNARDLSRIAAALEEIARVRAAMKDEDQKEDGRQ